MKQITLFGLIAISIILIGGFGYLSYSEHDDHDHDDEHSVEIEGKDMKALTVQEVSDLWEINSEKLLSEMVLEFELEKSYTTETILEEIREEYAFSPAFIKDMAEEIKKGAL